MMTVGWILNLDADLELADPTGFTPTRRLAQQSNVLADRLLVAANDADKRVRHVRLAPGSHTTTCQAWCPTPRAQAAARALGHVLPAMPPLRVSQQVNHRAFAAGFGLGLTNAAFVTSTQQLDALMQTATPAGGWLLKRPFGFSGRGQKRVSAVPTGRDRRWVEASMVEYGCGLMVEPFVTIDQEFALHSWLGSDGECLTGRPTRLITDELGAWLGSEPSPTLHDHEREQLHSAHAVAARALSAVGFFGPFSTDAFRYRDDDGQLHFHALSELNARYSMGFFVGLGDCLAEWARRIATQG
ncbi:MAG: hypothetical protein ACI85K_003526 [Hyphomicrobiaceae bacterium]|jgi:hypothetical protein